MLSSHLFAWLQSTHVGHTVILAFMWLGIGLTQVQVTSRLTMIGLNLVALSLEA